jgi:hypothetical protein
MMPPPTFVGSRACGDCHHEELKRWIGSHHQLAMQPATKTSVLGDFGDATIANAGITSTFFRRGEKFMVRTDGSDGTLHDYEIGLTFGVAPLQQYLIAMPGGRLQALGIAWDSRSHERWGRRWFFLNTDRKIAASDPLHWTGIDQTWSYICADCHSTNVRKNYDAQSPMQRRTPRSLSDARPATDRVPSIPIRQPAPGSSTIRRWSDELPVNRCPSRIWMKAPWPWRRFSKIRCGRYESKRRTGSLARRQMSFQATSAAPLTK